MLTNSDVVREVWSAIERRDWDVLRSLCDERCIYTLPQSGERYSRDGFVRLNREYPGEWHVNVQSLIGCETWVVTEVTVSFRDRIDTGVSLFRVDSGRVVEIREYWPEPFEVPAWRNDWAERL
ncbi:nuclear transport factor 2 family protein [Paraburkholderia lycopersici]|uniref:SnoaL-like domain-containing protein n=1 Tax=Paraburkholderia lycopersici TaxID=416944 RepID=A0A1G6GV52_9BURK|nr:nuclear transport factor 2 family protein [Paraburkholderia lycopersici]SDB85887.1 SnoaL-like domain-containing protein [Paraburkholderia lycopersici]